MAVYQILVCYFTAHEHLYMDYKNDISFLIDSTLNLYEHQSTWNPNMPLRGLRYFARLYEDYVRLNELNIYPLLFLPLVENAFKYVGGDYQLDIIMKWENNRISLFIRNSIPELSAEDEALRKSVDERQRKGIGLVNLRRRLSLLYPNKHRLETRKEETEFVAELMIEIEDI